MKFFDGFNINCELWWLNLGLFLLGTIGVYAIFNGVFQMAYSVKIMLSEKSREGFVRFNTSADTCIRAHSCGCTGSSIFHRKIDLRFALFGISFLSQAMLSGTHSRITCRGKPHTPNRVACGFSS